MSQLKNVNHEEFCRLYASDREFFGNGTQSYVEAYKINLSKKGAYRTAQVNASKLLSNPIILQRINEIFESRGLNDVFVDKQLELVITQNAELSAKVAAIKEYNQLRNRIKNKLEIEDNRETTQIRGELHEILKRITDDKGDGQNGTVADTTENTPTQ